MEKIGAEMLAYDPTKLNEQPMRMVELFKTPWPEEDYSEVRDQVVKLLAKGLDEQMEELAKERGWTEKTYAGWRKEHMRTPYKAVQRK